MADTFGIVPGIRYDKLAYWPIHTRESRQFLHLSYRRRKDAEKNQTEPVAQQTGMRGYAKRLLRQLLEADEPVVLIAHSMGAGVACALVDLIAERKLDGLVTGIHLVACCSLGGHPQWPYYIHPKFLGRMKSTEGVVGPPPEFAAAVSRIRQHYPDFAWECSGEESTRAIVQAATGAIAHPHSFSRKRMHLHWSRDDAVIPTFEFQRLIRQGRYPASEYVDIGGHSAPIIDTDGVLLERIMNHQWEQPALAAE
jgi:pimeloyl-ACP methyl ester carboxylesterase